MDQGDIHGIVLDSKWRKSLEAGIENELRSGQVQFLKRLKTLAVRYEANLSELNAEAESISLKVAAHLAEMGVGK